MKILETEKIIQVDGIQICTESFGNPEHPPLLLIMGASASMIWWDEEFCRRLANNGRFVIRYDNRDVGRSITYEPGNPQYNVIDMVNDATRVMNYYNLKRVHLVGMSLGGMIAQLLALRNPERVFTITMISSSIWDDRPDLPSIDSKILNYHSKGASVNWKDRDTAVNYMVGGWSLLNGSKHPFDEQRARKLAETEFDRANNLLSMFNHALLKGGESYYGKTSEIKVPALVIHGTEDPVLPFVHGEAISDEISNTELLNLEGSGHEIHYKEWDNIVTAIVKHTK